MAEFTNNWEVAASIPRMHSDEFASYVYDLGASLKNGDNVVECGVWLGASIACLAAGAADAGKTLNIWAYDNFKTSKPEVEKAARKGLKLKENQDVEKIFREYLENIKPKHNLIVKKGQIEKCDFEGEPIDVYIDDANKQTKNFHKALEKFGPYWQPDKTVIILMDYWEFKKPHNKSKIKELKCQHDFITKNKTYFEHLKNFKDSSPAIFSYKGKLF